jgi:hypothetical protein
MRQRFGESWGAVAFVDMGAVSPDSFGFVDQVRVGVGVGARCYTAIGPIRLDVAVPLRRDAHSGKWQLYVAIGQASEVFPLRPSKCLLGHSLPVAATESGISSMASADTVKGSGRLLVDGQSADAEYLIHISRPPELVDAYGYLTTESWAVRAMIDTGTTRLELEDGRAIEIVASRSDAASGAVHFSVADEAPRA